MVRPRCGTSSSTRDGRSREGEAGECHDPTACLKGNLGCSVGESWGARSKEGSGETLRDLLCGPGERVWDQDVCSEMERSPTAVTSVALVVKQTAV